MCNGLGCSSRADNSAPIIGNNTTPKQQEHKIKDQQKLLHLLDIISNGKITAEELKNTLKMIRNIEATEQPEFWVSIVNNANYTDTYRRYCLFEFFRRHVTPGRPFSDLIKIKGVSTWFDDKHTFSRNMMQGDVEPEWIEVFHQGGGAHMLQPYLPTTNNSAIYFLLSKRIDVADFLRIASGKVIDNELKIIEIGLGEVDDDEASKWSRIYKVDDMIMTKEKQHPFKPFDK